MSVKKILVLLLAVVMVVALAVLTVQTERNKPKEEDMDGNYDCIQLIVDGYEYNDTDGFWLRLYEEGTPRGVLCLAEEEIEIYWSVKNGKFYLKELITEFNENNYLTKLEFNEFDCRFEEGIIYLYLDGMECVFERVQG